MIPSHIKEAIDRHVEHGLKGGSFVEAVLANDLREAFGTADETSTRYLKDIVAYCYNEIPSPCWGSREGVRAWREKVRKAKASAPKCSCPSEIGAFPDENCPFHGEGGHPGDPYNFGDS